MVAQFEAERSERARQAPAATPERRICRAGTDAVNAARDDFGDMQKKGIIDPVKVTRSALENAVSIAGMVLTTNCLVTDLPEQQGAGAGAPPMY